MTNDIVKVISDHFPQVRIVFVAKVGSRVWGTSTPMSDVDIRFVYVYPKSEYLSLFPHTVETRDIHIEQNDTEYDIVGWDIFKFLRLLSKSNPQVLEWINSPAILYHSKVFEEIQRTSSNYDPYTLFRHYLSMAQSNYGKYIKDQTDPRLKIYLQVLRSILNAIYIVEFTSYPPLNLKECLNSIMNRSNDTWDLVIIREEVNELIKARSVDGNSEISSSLKFWISEVLEELQSKSGEYSELPSLNNTISRDDLEKILDSTLKL